MWLLAFHKLLLICRDFRHISTISRVYIIEYPVSDSCVERNAWLTSGLRGYNWLTSWMEAMERQQEGTTGYIQVLQNSISELTTHLTLKQFGHLSGQ